MPQPGNRLLDDIARLVTDAAGAAQGVRREVEAVVKGQLERILNEMEIAHREEVDALRDLAVQASDRAEALGQRVAQLEARLDAIEGARGPAEERPERAPM